MNGDIEFMPYLIVFVILSLTVYLFDQAFSSLVMVLLIGTLGLVSCSRAPLFGRKRAYMLLGIVSSVYIISALITSQNFIGNHAFLVPDALQYTQWINLVRPDDNYLSQILENYFELLDRDTLHEVYVRVVCIFANNNLGHASVLYLTLTHTIFGILAILSLYRALLLYYDYKKAFKYALVFALCSPFLFYSTVIIRDIIIAYFFMQGIEIVLQPYKSKNIIALLALVILAAGVRLFSGLFMLSFIAVYLTRRFEHTKIKMIIIPVFIILIAGVVAGGMVNALIEQTQEQLEYYQEYDANSAASSGGLSNYLLALPTGIKEVALFFYSQFMPFPFYAHLSTASNFTEVYQGITTIVYPIWWFYIFYMFFILYVFKGKYKQLSLSMNMFILLSFAYIFANTAQIDVRRMMHIYPFLFIMSLNCQNFLSTKKEVKKIGKLLMGGYALLLIAYLVIKG